MNQRFVIAVFVARAELQVTVQKQAQVVLEAREHEVLITGVSRENNFVGIDVVFRGGRDFLRLGHADSEPTEDDNTGDAQSLSGRKLLGEQERAPERDRGIDESEQQRGTYQAEARNEQDRKQERCSQRSQIVEGQYVGDYVAELVAFFHDAHEQRNFQAD